MKATINKLSIDLINKIAAGEVIQRPSSVIKELVENSIDAESTDIKLLIKDYGKTLIEISDNGVGMNEKDLRLCFLKHTTSKISKSSDLFSLTTNGFRGEAISSISSVAKIKISSSNNNDGVRNVLFIENGEITKFNQEGGLRGTTISVSSLFYNVPARRKFLKSDNVELRHIISEFSRQSLCNPGLSFSLKHNAKDLFVLNKSNLKERITRLFSKNIDKKLVPIDEVTDIASINGYVFKPEFLNKTNSLQFFFVNGRFIRNSYLSHSIATAYEGLIKPELRPSYILFIKTPADQIDVNVHPNKIEVKFENESSLYSIIRSSVRHALGKFNISPNIDFSDNVNITIPNIHSSKISTPSIDFNNDFNPFKNLGGNVNDEIKEISSDFKDHKLSSSMGIFSDHELRSSSTYSSFNFLNKFIVTKTKSELLIINIRKAYQRILYERILSEMNNKTNVSQTLLFPVKLSFSESDFSILNKLKKALSHLGFIFEKFSDNEIEVSGIHPVFKHDGLEGFFNELIENEILNYKEHSSSMNDYLAKLICLSKSINISHLVNEQEQILLLNQLFACKDSRFTPENKKIYIAIEDKEINTKFK
jgi:DNA mismatch repair protein MutL